MNQSTPSPADSKMSREDAVLLLEQTKDLLDDERAFGDKLVNDRKIKLSLVALLIGFGFFKIEETILLVDIAQASHIPNFIIWIVLGTLVFLLLMAIYWLVLENDPKFVRKILEDMKSNATEVNQNTANSDSANPKKLYGAALVVLFPDDELVEKCELDGFGEIANRISDRQSAYVRLAIANRKIRKRLEKGTFALLLEFTSVIILSGILVGMSLVADEETDTHGTSCVERGSE